MAKKKPKTIELEARFIEEYLIDLNATRAYKVCHPDCTYATCRTEGGRLLARPDIKAEVIASQAARRKRTSVSADKVVRELGRIAFADVADLFDSEGNMLGVREIPLETRRAIQSLTVKQLTSGRGRNKRLNGTAVVKIRFEPKSSALEKLCKHLGLIQEIPPLEALLSTIPEPLRGQIRQALAQAVSGSENPPVNQGGQPS